MLKNSGTNYPGVRVIDSNNNNLTIFRLDRSTNDVRLGAFDNTGINTGTVQVGGNDLQLYSKTGIKFIYGNQMDTIINNGDNFKITSESGKTTSLRYGSTMSYTDTDLELSKNWDSKVIISHGINILTQNENKPLTVTSTKYGKGRDIIIPYGMQFEATDDCLVINARNTSDILKQTKIPYKLRISIGNNGIIFHKPGDDITNDTSSHQLEIQFGMKFDYDENNFIIKKPGDPTKGVKIQWETL
jgi:hypothetical protein